MGRGWLNLTSDSPAYFKPIYTDTFSLGNKKELNQVTFNHLRHIDDPNDFVEVRDDNYRRFHNDVRLLAKGYNFNLDLKEERWLSIIEHRNSICNENRELALWRLLHLKELHMDFMKRMSDNFNCDRSLKSGRVYLGELNHAIKSLPYRPNIGHIFD